MNVTTSLNRSSYFVSVLIIGFVFIASRILASAVGLFFDTSSLNHFWIFFNPELLKTHFLECSFYQHTAPPGANLYIGAMLAMFPNHFVLVTHMIHIGLGASLAFAMHRLLLIFGCRLHLSVLVTCLFIVSPSVLLFENFLFYTFPLSCLLLLSAWALHGFIKRMSFRFGFLFFGLLALIMITRSLFHLVWLILIGSILALFTRIPKKTLFLTFLLPFLLVIFVNAKNLHLYGHFTSSSWFGNSLAKMTINPLSRDLIKKYVSDGQMSEIATIPPYSLLSEYPESWRHSEPVGSRCVDEIDPARRYNYNHVAYRKISDQYLKDATFALTNHPAAYLRQVLKSMRRWFFVPADANHWPKRNRPKIVHYTRFYNFLLLGQPEGGAYVAPLERKGSLWIIFLRKLSIHAYFLFAALIIVKIYGLKLFLVTLREKASPSPVVMTKLYLWGNILYVFIIGSFLETGENERFRVLVDPMIVILLALAFQTYFFKKKSISSATIS